MMMTYEQLFNEVRKKYKTPLDKGDHPVINETKLMDKKMVLQSTSHWLASSDGWSPWEDSMYIRLL